MAEFFDTIADVGSDEEEDEDFDGEAGDAAEPRPKKINGANGIDDSSEEEDDDDEDRLRQVSLAVLAGASADVNGHIGRRRLYRRRGRRRRDRRAQTSAQEEEEGPSRGRGPR